MKKKKQKLHKRLAKILRMASIVIVTAFILVLHTEASESLEAEKIAFSADGSFRMTTYDRKATSGTTYKTIGWLIKKYNQPVSANNPGAILVLSENAQPQTDPENEEMIFSYFSCGKEFVWNAIGTADKEWQQTLYSSGGLVYLDAIMTVSEQGVLQGAVSYGGTGGEVYQTYEGIANARNWANKSLLKTHYGKELYFPAIGISEDTVAGTRIDYYNCTSLGQPEVTGDFQVKAEEKGAESFEILEGIPTGEEIYTDGIASRFYYIAAYTKKSGTKTYPVTIKARYHLTWKDIKGEQHIEDIEQSHTYMITRAYSYWVLEDFQFYYLDSAEITNYAFANNIVILQNAELPTVQVRSSKAETDHLTEASGGYYEVEGGMLDGGMVRPSLPEGDYYNLAESKVGQIMVKNDMVMVDQIYLLNEQVCEKSTPEPQKPEGNITTAFTLRKQLIPDTKANGLYLSKGILNYKRYETGTIQKSEIRNINSVRIHTPVVCIGKVTDDKGYNQEIEPDKDRAALILGRNFRVRVETNGQHRDIKGYGKRDYAEYIKSRQVKFPFEVYYENQLIPKEQWIILKREDIEFYLPSGVKEGNYRIDYRSLAMNYEAVPNAIEKKEQSANLGMDHYIATDFAEVRVLGRLYGFQIIDIMDYPRWEAVFREADKITLTNATYLVGNKNQNGEERKDEDQKDEDQNGEDQNGEVRKEEDQKSEDLKGRQQKKEMTLPLFRGKHPTDKQEGALKKGYGFRYKVTTVGNLYEKDDTIEIIPRFFVLDKDGKGRKEVDIYYNESIHNEKQWFVQIGSKRDKTNIKTISMLDVYSTVPKEALKRAALLNEKNYPEVYKAPIPVYTYEKIVLSERTRIYGGSRDRNTANVVKAEKSVQEWLGEYALPAEMFIVEKGTDLLQYLDKKGSIQVRDSIFIKSGYLVVNFQIYTKPQGKAKLSYTNVENSRSGYCNMWKTEGFSYENVDSNGKQFLFQEGDVCLYDISKNVNQDYRTYGTH